MPTHGTLRFSEISASMLRSYAQSITMKYLKSCNVVIDAIGTLRSTGADIGLTTEVHLDTQQPALMFDQFAE